MHGDLEKHIWIIHVLSQTVQSSSEEIKAFYLPGEFIIQRAHFNFYNASRLDTIASTFFPPIIHPLSLPFSIRRRLESYHNFIRVIPAKRSFWFTDQIRLSKSISDQFLVEINESEVQYVSDCRTCTVVSLWTIFLVRTAHKTLETVLTTVAHANKSMFLVANGNQTLERTTLGWNTQQKMFFILDLLKYPPLMTAWHISLGFTMVGLSWSRSS